jgi:hypothetical protein
VKQNILKRTLKVPLRCRHLKKSLVALQKRHRANPLPLLMNELLHRYFVSRIRLREFYMLQAALQRVLLEDVSLK